MNTKIFLVPNEDGSRTAILGASEQPKSMLADLTTAERAALNDWIAAQTGDPVRGGAVDVMLWPGWGDVFSRRIKQHSMVAKVAG